MYFPSSVDSTTGDGDCNDAAGTGTVVRTAASKYVHFPQNEEDLCVVVGYRDKTSVEDKSTVFYTSVESLRFQYDFEWECKMAIRADLSWYEWKLNR